MSNPDLIDPKDAKNEKSVLCTGQCNYIFQPTKTTNTKIDDNTDEQRIETGLLFCSTCTHSVDIDLEHDDGPKTS